MKNFWKNKKVLVTGGAGFIGSHAVDKLLKEGAKITAVISPKTTKETVNVNLDKTKDKIQIKKGNLMCLNDCLKLTQNQNVVLNFAALDGGLVFKTKYPALIFKTNTEIILNMLEASRLNNIDNFLLMSSVEVYPQNVPSPIKEEYVYRGNLDTNNGYAWSKKMAEIAAIQYYRQYGLKIAIARVGNVYGDGDDISKGRVIPTFIDKALHNKNIYITGNPRSKITFLHVEDLISILFSLTENYCICDPVNIVGSRLINMLELAKKIIELTSSNSKILTNSNNLSIKNMRFSTAKLRQIIKYNKEISLENGLSSVIKYSSK